jgi:hypothetical protein
MATAKIGYAAMLDAVEEIVASHSEGPSESTLG